MAEQRNLGAMGKRGPATRRQRQPEGLRGLPGLERGPLPATPNAGGLRELPGLVREPAEATPDAGSLRDLPGVVNLPQQVGEMPQRQNLPQMQMPVNLNPEIQGQASNLQELFAQLQMQRQMEEQQRAMQMQQLMAQIQAQRAQQMGMM